MKAEGGVVPMPVFKLHTAAPLPWSLLPPTPGWALSSLSLPCFFLAFQASAGAPERRGEESPLRPLRLSELAQGLESRASWAG